MNPLWWLLLPDLSYRQQSIPHNTGNHRHLKGGSSMRGFKVLIGSTALLAGLALTPVAQAQIEVSVGVPPVCSYGYYDYAPYACAPYGFYGPGYFYGGVFLGMGPWAGWGYGHGWGSHRFSNGGGGSYRGGGGAMANRSNYAHGGGGPVRGNAASSHASGARPSVSHAAPVRASTSHASAPHASSSHASAPRASDSRGGGGGGHAGGGGGRR